MALGNGQVPLCAAMAWRIRDGQWRFMERVASAGTLWWCNWDKRGLPEGADECRMGLISGMELAAWIHTHSDWWEIGAWDDARYAMPVALTAAWHDALAHLALYDAEPVTGGLVEPGWACVPALEDSL